ncbi:glycoside hydrolase family 25 protein [Flammeovirga kamogawensis]|uniref:Lysozyme n=1 Tax=Flammeovirga kamogawensis TaxID=373891 RepID=A0ABX8GXV9_9BACT|nr:glycoside hydrolase family 25 protein [Flammeovirga kamogawensis]MBB6460893.1 lysozyme [Flammeovirga kamogawensis]QWG08238.1 glycoside hydrolase family 25 protein [Flammeovirga kamogawensis]TRX70041.1 glycoside hydrolase family 25 protein [Flammeovirga kamogawensis]
MKKGLLFIIVLLIVVIICSVSIRKKIGYAVHGIDVSYYQEDINFEKVVNDGFSFVFMKASESHSLKDKQFDRNWGNAAKSNLVRGAYHFFRADKDPVHQANWFVRHVKLEPGDLPPVLDLETTEGISIGTVRERAKVWLNLIENQYKITPIIYTNLSFYEDYLLGREAFEKYPVWIAAYSSFTHPKLSDKSKKWIFWQYTDNGNVKGIRGDVDLNVFDGTLNDLKRLCIQGKYNLEPLNKTTPKSLPQIGKMK